MILLKIDSLPGKPNDMIVDDGAVIRLLVRRRVQVTDPAAGFGLIKVKRAGNANGRRLSDFNAADLLRQPNIKK